MKYIADAYASKNDNQAALHYYQRARLLEGIKEDIDLQSDICCSVAKLYIKSENLDSALFSANLGLAYANVVQQKMRIRDAYHVLAQIYHAKNEFNTAAKCYQL